MSLSPTSRSIDRLRAASPRGGAGSFTLVEVMVAIAVFTLLMALLGQMLGTMSKTWGAGQQRVNNFTKARAMLDLLARDLEGGVFRDDLAAFPGAVAFYTLRPGISSTGTVRNISLVSYLIDTNSAQSILQRGDLAIGWDDPASSISFGNTNSLAKLPNVIQRDTSPGVVAFQLLFVRNDGTFSRDYTSAACAVGITVAVVDDQAIRQMSAGQITLLRTGLNNAVLGTRSAQADWKAYLKGLNWSSYPKSLPVGLKTFERYVSLPAH